MRGERRGRRPARDRATGPRVFGLTDRASANEFSDDAVATLQQDSGASNF